MYLLIAVLPLILFSLGASHASPYASVSINGIITQQSPSISFSHINYTIEFFNPPSSVNISLPQNSVEIEILEGGSVYNDFKEFPASSCHIFPQYLGQNCLIFQLNSVSNNSIFTVRYEYNTSFQPGATYFNSTTVFLALGLPFTRISPLSVGMLLPKQSFIPPMPYCLPISSCSFHPVPNGLVVNWSISSQTPSLNSSWYIQVPFIATYGASFPKPANYDYYVVILIGIALVFLALLLLKPKRGNGMPQKKSAKRNPFYNILSSDEKRVLSAIKKDWSTVEKDIVSLTGFSKSKVSKIVSKLSNYRLVKVKFDGRFKRLKKT